MIVKVYSEVCQIYKKKLLHDVDLLTLTLLQDLRHKREQNEGMTGYGWTAHDTRGGGTQTTHNSGNGLAITTEFSKTPDVLHGGNWGAKVKGVPRPDVPKDLKTTEIFYVAMEDLPSADTSRLECITRQDREQFDTATEFQGTCTALKGLPADLLKACRF